MNHRSIVKIIGVACIMLFIVPHVVEAMEYKYTAQFSDADLIFDKLMGYDVVKIKDGDWINDVGKPMMPTKEIKIALPFGMEVKGIRIIDTQSRDIKGEYNIFPAQPPIRTSGVDDDAVFVQPDVEIYSSMEHYPSKTVEFVHQTDLAGQAMAVIQLFPIQYIPGEKKLTLNTKISFVVEGVDGYKCGDYLNSEKNRGKYEQMIKDMVVNPEDVRLQTAPYDSPTTRALSGGPYEHVIISRSADVSYWQVLSDWYTKRGLRSKVVTTDWIYATYSGSDNQERIRNFIIEAHKSQAQGGWETDYVLIGGEDGDVPFKDKTYVSESIPSDQYYGDYDDDWTYEVYVGRSTARASTQVNRFVNKVLKYEKTPPLSNYILDVTLLGMDITTVAVDGILTRGEYLKEYIDDYYIPSRFTITEVYDTDPCPPNHHKTDFINALSDGQNLVNHNDHGNTTLMSTGARNHGWYISNSTVDGLTNNNRLSVIYSIGCHCNEMDHSSDCIAEHFVIYNSLQAGVAFTGNTRSGWINGGDPYSLSCKLDQYWWRGLFNYNKYILGEALAYTKDECPHSSSYWRYCQWTLNLLGEPAMPIWTDTPELLAVTHPATLPTGSSSFLVHVEEEDGGGDVDNAYVCLWKGDEVYLTDYTTASGNVTFNPAPTSLGDMYVTVTQYDYTDNSACYLPYEGTAEVVEPTFTIDGHVFASDGITEVLDPIVTIDNLDDTEAEWTATVASGSNYYSLELSGTDIPSVDDVFRITAKKALDEGIYDPDGYTYSINITNHVVTTTDITPNNGFTEDLNLDHYCINYDPDYPYHIEEQLHYSGAAVMEMWIDFKSEESYSQDQLYGWGIANNRTPDFDEIDPQGMATTLNDLLPLFHFTVGVMAGDEAGLDFALHRICWWQYLGPGALPTGEDYTSWMAVRGIHTDKRPQDGQFGGWGYDVYGFWINDPDDSPSSLGANSYKTATEWTTTYYSIITDPNNPEWNGKYITVLEPPEGDAQIHIASPIPRFSEHQMNYISEMSDRTAILEDVRLWIIQAAINGVTEELIPYDENFKEVFEKTQSGNPFFVASINGNDYYTVPFSIPARTGKKQSNKRVSNAEQAMVVILIDADDGSFKEVSWTDTPVEYLPISKDEAQQMTADAAEGLGLTVYDIDDIQPELIHLKSTPYYPQWRTIIKEYAIYINQDGTVSIDEWGFGPGGPMSQDEGTSFTYALKTAAPSPFVNHTTISYSIAKSGNVSLTIYDVTGRLVKTLVDANKDAGVYNLTWNGYDNNNQKLAHGVYFTKLSSGEFVSVKKLILVR